MGFRLRLWSFPCVASMKALPNRKGNTNRPRPLIYQKPASIKALPKRKGNHVAGEDPPRRDRASMKAPPKKEGKSEA